jgi:hypothetical protein
MYIDTGRNRTKTVSMTDTFQKDNSVGRSGQIGYTLSNNKSFRLRDVTKMILWAEVFIAKEKEDILDLKSIPCNMPPT